MKKCFAELAEADQPDLVSSSDTYSKRFSGPIGRWLLGRQTSILLNFMGHYRRAQVLDVGGGHAQVAPSLAAEGHDVTVWVSAIGAGDRLKRLSKDEIKIVVGNLMRLHVEDQSFDVVTAFRMLAHVADWRVFLGELCRVSSDAVIVDFPVPSGANALAPVLFGFKKIIEKDARRFRSITVSEVTAALEENGFHVDSYVGEFVLPMAFHRALKSQKISDLLEKLLSPLVFRFGNPVILRARRIERSDRSRS